MASVDEINLMAAFALYLVAAYLLNVGLRFHTYWFAFRTVLAAPSRYPRTIRLLKGQWTVLIEWRAVTAFSLAGLGLLAHVVAFRFIWTQATVSITDLSNQPVFWFIALATGLVMVVLDLLEVLQTTQFDGARMARLLDRAESLLGGITGTFVRPLARRILRRSLEVSSPLVRRWFIRRSLAFANQFAFGLSLWGAWVFGGAAAS